MSNTRSGATTNIGEKRVSIDDDGYKSVRYDLMVSLGIGSVQEQQKRIDLIYKRINKLKELISG
jgi:hypothetical protein